MFFYRPTLQISSANCKTSLTVNHLQVMLIVIPARRKTVMRRMMSQSLRTSTFRLPRRSMRCFWSTRGINTGLFLTVSSLVCSLVNLTPRGRLGLLWLGLFWREEQISRLGRTSPTTVTSLASSTPSSSCRIISSTSLPTGFWCIKKRP